MFEDSFLMLLRRVAKAEAQATEITRALTNLISTHLQSKGWAVSKEHGISLYRASKKKKGCEYLYQGHIDLCAEKAGKRLAIEIDRANKAWSLKKLEHCASNGYTAIWFRWRGRVNNYAPTVKIYNIAPTARFSRDRATSGVAARQCHAHSGHQSR